MTRGLQTVIYPVTDLERAKALYAALLGVPPHTDAPYYVGFAVGGQQVGLDPHGAEQGLTGAVGYWHVDDLRARLQELVDAGATVRQDVKDVGGGKLVAAVEDQDGNLVGLLQE